MMKDDYEMEEHKRFVWLNDAGIEKAQKFWGVESLYSAEAQSELRITMLLMRAHFLMHKDKDYVVLDDEVLIIIDILVVRFQAGALMMDSIRQSKQKRVLK